MQAWTGRHAQYVSDLLAPFPEGVLTMGMAIAGEQVYTATFGQNAGQLAPMGLASVTKVFVCTALMQLQEAGRLSVHDPIGRYLPEWPWGKQVTLHHLMTHTSGLPPLGTPGYFVRRHLARTQAEQEQIPQVDTVEQVVTLHASRGITMLGNPGEHFSYANDGYILLGGVVERVSGQPFTTYVTERILRPAAMVNSHFRPIFPGGNGPMDPLGSLHSTVPDMLRFLEMVRDGGRVGHERILSPASVAAMITPYIPCEPGRSYGYGLVIQSDYHGVTLIGHNGTFRGVGAHILISPERCITGVALANDGAVPHAKALLSAFNLEFGLPPETPRFTYMEMVCPPEQLARYEGRYRSEEGTDLHVKLASRGQLALNHDGESLLVRPVGEHLFTSTIPDLERLYRFLPGEKGDIWAVFTAFRIVPRDE